MTKIQKRPGMKQGAVKPVRAPKSTPAKTEKKSG